MRPSFSLLTFVFGLAACESGDQTVPDLVAHPDAPKPTVVTPATPNAPPPTTPNNANVIEMAPKPVEPEAPPPWPELKVTPGRYSVDFAEDYVRSVLAERTALDEELAKPRDPPKTAAEAKHQQIRDRGRRERLMNKPNLSAITDEQISDFLSFNPDAKSGDVEWPRLLSEHPQSLGICIDHARWLNFREKREAALAEYTRCMKSPGITEDQLRYLTTSIAAVKNQPLPTAKKKP